MNNKSPKILYQINDAKKVRSQTMFNPMGFTFDGSPKKLGGSTQKKSFEECKVFQDDTYLVLLAMEPEACKIICAINYKNIIEMSEYHESDHYNKYSLKASNTIQIKYVKSYH
jgi:hypothetical protein